MMGNLLYDLYKDSVNVEERNRLYSCYLRQKRIYKTKIAAAKRQANVEHIKQSHNPTRAAWELINTHRGRRTSPVNVASPDSFNKFFVGSVEAIVEKIGPAESDPALGVPATNAHPPFTTWTPITPSEIVMIVNNFSNSNSQDIYGMTPAILKAVIHIIAEPLSKIINSCLETGIFPEPLKISKTVPVFKKGDPSDLKNYRPISVIPVFAKVFEAVIKKQLEDFFESNNLFHPVQ